MSITPLAGLGTAENTGEKPQSKLWEHAGHWWAALPDDGAVWISRLDGTSWTRVLELGNSDSIHVDVKANGDLAHLLLLDGADSQFATIEYSSITNTYRPWALQPNLVSMGLPDGIETATIDLDSTGRMWVAYDQSSTVEVRYADGFYNNWSSPIVVASGIGGDDISVITALPDGKMGVFWSNQKTKLFGFRYHVDGTSPTQWSADERPGSLTESGSLADDHVNVAVTSDGTVYAAIKTSYDSSSRTAIGLFVRDPDGTWSRLYQVDTRGTRPIVVVNELANRVIVAYTSSEGGGDILYKESPLDNISFGPRQVMISGSVNNVTSTKQTFDDGVVLMAAGGSTARAVYFSFDVAIPNQAPTVDAGPNRNITLGGSAALDGTVNDDGPIGALNLQWAKVSGPGNVSFGNATSVDTTATFSLAGTYVLRLTASDGTLSSSDTMTVVVAAPVTNQAPQVNAGADQTLPVGVPVALSGSVTDDGLPGTGLTTTWTRVSGPGTVTFGNAASPTTSAQFSTAGTYVLRLTANDGSLTASDDVTIVIQSVVVNQAPLVDAGSDQSVILGNSVNLAGSVVDDSAPGAMAYTWSRVSGPGTATFGNASSLNTSASFSVAGSYVLRLTVSDGQFTASDTLTVTVNQGSAPVTTSFQNGVNGYSGTRDTMILAGSNSSAGSATNLSMDGSPDSSVLLAWDLSSIPAGSIVDSVRIDLYVTNTSKTAYSAYGVLKGWNNSATWSATGTGSSWSSAGAQGSADRGPLVGQLSGTSTGSTALTLNASGLALVQSWVGDPNANFGLILQNYAASNGLDIASSEASTASQRPRLTITYRAPANPTPNTAPVVDAGPNRTTTMGTAVALSGSATDDGQPNPLTSTWSRISGPGSVTFGNASSPATTAQFSAAGTYVLRLTASDGALSTSDDVTVVVNPLNQAPNVSAGIDQTVDFGTLVTLAGSASDDGHPGPLSTQWSAISGPGNVQFTNAQSPTSTVSFTSPGTYVLRLAATDGDLIRSDDVTIVVNQVVVNQAPQVDAGNNQTASVGQVVQLDATVTDDGIAGPLTTTWSLDSGPAPVTFGNSSMVDTSVQFQTPGTYVLRLVVSDGEFSASDTVTLSVTPANNAPQVEAGGNQTIFFGSVAQLNGTASDDGVGTGLTTLWTRDSGPGTVTFGTPSSLSSTVQFSQPGTHVLRLTASDGLTSSSDTLTIVVEAVNQPPQVNAGPNLTVNVGASLSIDATVTDDGLPAALTTQWVAISGPGNVTFGSATSVDTNVTFSQAGNYILRLTASDGALLDQDEITVTVLSPSTPITAEFQQGLNGYTGTRDTMIESGSANRNNGNATSMSMDGKPDSGVLLGWDLSTIPMGSLIVSASIELYVTNSSRDTYDVYALDRAWDELSATWSQAMDGSSWSSAGAQGSGDLSGGAVGQLTGRSTGSTTLELNELGLAMIQSWIDDPLSNHGLIFQNYGAGNGLDIASSEASSLSQRPKLKLEFAPVVVPHNSPETFFSEAQETPIGQEQAIYPYGPNMAFGLFSVVGMNDYDPTKTNMERVAEEGFNLVGPYNSKNWQTDLPLVHQAHDLGLEFIYMVRQHPSLVGVPYDSRPAAISLLSDAEIAAYARTQVEAILDDPIARESVKFWTTQPDEIRHWIAEEMRYLRIATETIRQVEAERGEAHRPIWSYEPNHRPADQMVITGQYQDVVSRGAYFTTRFDRGTDRAGWAMWSYQQIVEAATTLGNVPQAVFELLQDFTDPATAGSAAEITRVIRHDVYLALTMGIKGLNVFSMYEDRPNLTTHNEQFEAYGTIAKDLLGELDLDRVLLTGQEMADLEFSVASGPAQFDYLHQGTTPYTFDFLNTRHLAIGDERYVFMVNSAESPMDVRIEGLPSQYVVDDLFAGTSTAGGGDMTVGLDVLGVKVLRFRQA